MKMFYKIAVTLLLVVTTTSSKGLLSVAQRAAVHCTGTIYHMIFIFGTHVWKDNICRHFYIFFQILIFGVSNRVKGQKMTQNNKKLCLLHSIYSLFYLMHAIAGPHGSTPSTSFMCVKAAHPNSVYNTYCLGHYNEENERKIKNTKSLNSYHFSLTFVNLLLAWMLYFCV